MGPERTDLGSERADWGLRGALGGDVRTDVRTYGRTDVWKFTPVSYRTSALWGRCPKRKEKKKKEKERKRKKKKKKIKIRKKKKAKQRESEKKKEEVKRSKGG